MANYQKARVKLTNTQLNKLKSAAKNKTGTILRLNKKNFKVEELPHELFLTERKTAKLINVFATNISADGKLSKTQISKIIQSSESFGSWLANFGKNHYQFTCNSFGYNQFTWISKQFNFKYNK